MNTTTYKQTEDILTANGFKFEFGIPIKGMRFKGATQYAFVLRMGANNYETTYYDIAPAN